jgi:DNA-binding beta-propeller fold protein YncE
MKRIAIFALALTACGGKYKAPPAQASIALKTGADLKPYDAGKPGNAYPQGLAQVGDKVYASLSNQRIDPSSGYPVIAGPGFLVGVVPSTGAQTLIDLGGSDGKQCQDPGFVRDSNGKLYAPCSGDFSGADNGRALVEVDPATAQVTRRAAIPSGLVPNGVAPGPTKIWMGDAFSLRVFSVDRATFVADDPAKALALTCPQTPKTGFSYVADVAILYGDLYALCASDSAGVLFRFDAATGAAKGQVAVGPTPSELTATGDGRIAVINSANNTLSLVTINGATLTADNQALTFPSGTATLQDVRARDNYLYTVASASNSAQKIDLAAKGGPKIIQAASFPNGANPYNIFPLDDDQAIVTDRQTNAISAVQWVNVP